MKQEVSLALQTIADQVINTAENTMSVVEDWQVIKQFMSNRLKSIKLTPEQKKNGAIPVYL